MAQAAGAPARSGWAPEEGAVAMDWDPPGAAAAAVPAATAAAPSQEAGTDQPAAVTRPSDAPGASACAPGSATPAGPAAAAQHAGPAGDAAAGPSPPAESPRIGLASNPVAPGTDRPLPPQLNGSSAARERDGSAPGAGTPQEAQGAPQTAAAAAAAGAAVAGRGMPEEEEAERRKRRREAWEREQEGRRRWDLHRRLADISTDIEALTREVSPAWPPLPALLRAPWAPACLA